MQFEHIVKLYKDSGLCRHKLTLVSYLSTLGLSDEDHRLEWDHIVNSSCKECDKIKMTALEKLTFDDVKNMLSNYSDVENERQFQFRKWGEQNHSAERWLAILTEEVGEVAKAILENKDEEYHRELVQVGATVMSMLASYKKNGMEGK